MEPFKNVFNKDSLALMADSLSAIDAHFDNKRFLKACLQKISDKELKDRVREISTTLHEFLPGDFSKNVSLLVRSLKESEEHTDNNWTGKNKEKALGVSGFLVWPYTYYIETYGMDDVALSLDALYEMTKRFTSEFAIRAFLENHYEQTMQTLIFWLSDENHHVRRLVSEGTRPFLPWAMKVGHLCSDPLFHIQILSRLVDDSSEYVRKSVSNHLNDLSKISPEVVLDFCHSINDINAKERQKLIRHALRTLLKSSNKEALNLVGHSHDLQVNVEKLSVDKKKIKLGEAFELSFEIELLEEAQHQVLLDYVIHMPRKNGSFSQKVYRLKNTQLTPGHKVRVLKKIQIKPVTVRTYYEGNHFVELRVNGTSYGKILFDLEV